MFDAEPNMNCCGLGPLLLFALLTIALRSRLRLINGSCQIYTTEYIIQEPQRSGVFAYHIVCLLYNFRTQIVINAWKYERKL